MIEGQVLGTEVIQRFHAMPPSLREQLFEAIDKLSKTLTNKTKAKLSGAVLTRRTGMLRRSITPAVISGGDTVTGVVSTAVKYARIHEYGFNGTESVKSHLRTIKQAFGRSIIPVTFEVAAHTRHVNMPERSFLRSTLNEMETSGAIRKGIARAVRKATA
jgi:phage gpG-like protein